MKTDYVFGDRVKVLPKLDEATEYLDKVKDGVVCVNSIDLQQEEHHYKVGYTSGTLQEFVDNLGEKQ